MNFQTRYERVFVPTTGGPVDTEIPLKKYIHSGLVLRILNKSTRCISRSVREREEPRLEITAFSSNPTWDHSRRCRPRDNSLLDHVYVVVTGERLAEIIQMELELLDQPSDSGIRSGA